MGLDRYNLEDMELIHDIALGFIQGITEFIPVSSSGHLVIGQYLYKFLLPILRALKRDI